MMTPDGYCVVALERPRHGFHVGAALRLAENYGVRMVVTSGRRYHGALTDVFRTAKRVPLVQARGEVLDCIPYDCVPVGVEIARGGCPLPSYVHPVRAFYVFGPEDGGLGARVLARCRDVIYVPTARCLNLAVAVGTVLYDRLAKAEAR